MKQEERLYLQLFGDPHKIIMKIEYLIKIMIKIDANCILKPGKILNNGQKITLIGKRETIKKIKRKINEDKFIYN